MENKGQQCRDMSKCGDMSKFQRAQKQSVRPGGLWQGNPRRDS